MIRRLIDRVHNWAGEQIDRLATADVRPTKPDTCCHCGRPATDPCDDMTWWRSIK